MDGPRWYYVKGSKSDRERQIPYDFTYMWNIKNQNKWTNITKQKQTHRYREQTGGCQRGGGVGGRMKYVREIKRYRIPVIK